MKTKFFSVILINLKLLTDLDFSTGYKGFDLSMFFQGNARVSFFIDPRNTSPFCKLRCRWNVRVFNNVWML